MFTFGYNANVAFGNTTADIVDHARDLLGCLIDQREHESETGRPIIFVAHSLGGIIVKQALVMAHEGSQFINIREHTLGVVFFGTPHRGSSKASYGMILADIAATVMHKPNSKLIDALQSNSAPLTSLTARFHTLAIDFQVVTFYEMQPIKGLTSLVSIGTCIQPLTVLTTISS